MKETKTNFRLFLLLLVFAFQVQAGEPLPILNNDSWSPTLTAVLQRDGFQYPTGVEGFLKEFTESGGNIVGQNADGDYVLKVRVHGNRLYRGQPAEFGFCMLPPNDDDVGKIRGLTATTNISHLAMSPKNGAVRWAREETAEALGHYMLAPEVRAKLAHETIIEPHITEIYKKQKQGAVAYIDPFSNNPGYPTPASIPSIVLVQQENAACSKATTVVNNVFNCACEDQPQRSVAAGTWQGKAAPRSVKVKLSRSTRAASAVAGHAAANLGLGLLQNRMDNYALEELDKRRAGLECNRGAAEYGHALEINQRNREAWTKQMTDPNASWWQKILASYSLGKMDQSP